LDVTDSVDLDVAQNSIHALIGPNGAGKTTLISQLSGQLTPDSGHVIYDGKEITHLSMPSRVKIGLARSFQLTSILPSLTLLENVAIAVQARSGSSFRFFRPAARDAALNDEAMIYLKEVGLADAPDRLAGAVSHGEKRQLEIAIALGTKPRLLLLDEPLAGTGPQEAEILIDVMRRLRGRVTLLLIEHDMDAVFKLADRISVLVYGRVVAEGNADHIRNDPKVRAAYLGEEEGDS
jgi:branched-chain amino acid transport system ATP-binding protein